MITPVTETKYPLRFRHEEAEKLGQLIQNRHSVILVGMKRVGISNFLKFFLFHPQVQETYVNDGQKHLFIHLDLNDLVEREIFPFWTLTLKRIVDAVQASDMPTAAKKEIESLFLNSIQTNDLFLTIDCVRQCILKIISHNYLPTIFFIRFDRMKDTATAEMINNLRGIHEASGRKLMYIFTTFRELDAFSPIFKTAILTLYCQNIYIKTASLEDQKIIYQADKDRFKINFSTELEDELLHLVGGYTQYLFLALISLHHHPVKISSKEELLDYLIKDEEISSQSEELWENLTAEEQSVLVKINQGQDLTETEQADASYLINTGFIFEKDGKFKIFSQLFNEFLNHKGESTSNGNGNGHSKDLTDKENKLFNFLKDNLDEVCEREAIIESVWPEEEEEIGVTDWAVDRLVARVRSKLKSQNSPYEIVTVKTRGYKLTQN